jgi:hypothetical protein
MSVQSPYYTYILKGVSVELLRLPVEKKRLMAQTIIFQLPDETLQRYRRGAMAAPKLLEEFLI